jgi:hypothetical protein
VGAEVGELDPLDGRIDKRMCLAMGGDCQVVSGAHLVDVVAEEELAEVVFD